MFEVPSYSGTSSTQQGRRCAAAMVLLLLVLLLLLLLLVFVLVLRSTFFLLSIQFNNTRLLNERPDVRATFDENRTRRRARSGAPIVSKMSPRTESTRGFSRGLELTSHSFRTDTY